MFELERVVSLNTHEIVHTRVVVLCLFATIIHLLIGTVCRCNEICGTFANGLIYNMYRFKSSLEVCFLLLLSFILSSRNT